MRRRNFLAAGMMTLAAPSLALGQASRVLRVIPQGDLALLDPTITTATVTRNHAFMVFDTLYGLTAEGEPVPEMVAGHRTEDDGKTWILTLRDGLRFHDGEPVRAADCVASLRRWGRTDPFGKTLMAATDELSAPDDRTIRFRLRKPFPLLPLALAKTVPRAPFIMPERLIPAEPGVAIKEMVGSGPFRFVAGERVPGARVVYERFDGYVPRPSGTPGLSCGPKVVHFDRVEWQVIPDAATALGAIQRGEVDWWERPLPDLIPAAHRDRNLKVEVTNRAGTIAFLQFNHLYPPFDNVAIRRLVLSAINQADFTQASGGSDPSLWGGKLGIFLPGAPMASEAGMEAFTGRTDFDALKRELAAAGYKGERVVMLVGTDSPVTNAASEVAADLLRKMGFNVDYQAQDWGSVVQRRTSQQPPERGGWNLFAVSADGDFFLDPTVAPAIRANGKDAWIGWPNSPRIEELYQAWFNAPDQATRQAVARDLQLQTWKDVPYIPVAQVFLPTVVRRDVTGVLPGFVKFWNVKKG
ncbi:ABC transporter substrate-binding protein [Limobrevibacterium gyesilva]|uniref:ABC transporter substrate-binding protein n=1 Tax=Limobrevibacterium gyesilva TaxID=2991712 RepID=A0AA42CFU2_9PROT|nr:ABC transporter substrate-binding protein [Limobrevibacterium gyesilva]MCW3477034.1 ABC transporter substrate-binding protein [Limobrevibacterium gyesilva]